MPFRLRSVVRRANGQQMRGFVEMAFKASLGAAKIGKTLRRREESRFSCCLSVHEDHDGIRGVLPLRRPTGPTPFLYDPRTLVYGRPR